MNGPLLVALLVAFGVLLGFVGLWRLVSSRDPVEARLEEYGVDGREPVSVDSDSYAPEQRRAWPGVERLLAGFGVGPRLARSLARADLSLTAAEFALLVLGLGVVGFMVGTTRLNPLLGLALGAVCGYVPILYLRFRESRRQRAFTQQLPDVLTLLVGALRAGYGLTQSLEMLVDEMPPPSSTEFARVLRGVELGLPVQRALSDMAERIGTDDVSLVVTAIIAQYDMGGNLAQTLDTIGETVRDRIRIMREIRVLTAQQRMSGYVLAATPIVLGIMLFVVNPEYMSGLFEPGWIRLLPAVAIIMQVIGFLLIRRIVDIEV